MIQNFEFTYTKELVLKGLWPNSMLVTCQLISCVFKSQYRCVNNLPSLKGAYD